ncbi:MAG: hypothetical protein KDE22_10900 [Rhodobacterales bacterium]|nr:hypothetical protein [Rhodobacterales bacterium]
MSHSVNRTRRGVVKAAAAGLLSLPLAARGLRAQSADGVKSVQGRVLIDGRLATPGMAVTADSQVETGPGAQAVFTIGDSGFLVRGRTLVILRGEAPKDDRPSAVVRALTIISGALLSVHGKGAKSIDTPVATIGIRGTGLYVEARPNETYACTCYGTVDLAARADPGVRETVVTKYHDAPRLIRPDAILKARVMNHSDRELVLLESLFGRMPPFGQGGRY